MLKKNYFEQHSLNFDRLKRLISNKSSISDDLIKLMRDYESAIDFYDEYLSHLSDDEIKNYLKLSRLALVQIAGLVNTSYNPNLSVNLIRLRSFEGGLANRLRALCASLVISDILKKNLEISWIPDDHCDLDFNNMFPQPFFCNFANIKPSVYIESIMFSSECSIEIIGNPSPWLVWEKYCKEVIDWGTFYSLYREFLKLIFVDKLNTNILFDANKLLYNNIMDDVVGLHIRSTDFQRHYELTYPDRKLAKVDDFIAVLNEREISKVFLATDSISVRQDFVKNFQGQIINLEHNFQDSNFRQTSIKSAFCDIYTLSKCKFMIATYGSSFSGMAADLSGNDVLYI
jgi:hypothetical protein